MKRENLTLGRTRQRLKKLTSELKEVKNSYNDQLDEILNYFRDNENKNELSMRFNELVNEVFNENLKLTISDQVFLLSLKVAILSDDEKERMIRLTRHVFGFEKLENKMVYLSMSEYRDYLYYVLNTKMDVSIEELSTIVHVSTYSISRNIDYRSKRGFRSFSK